MHGPKLRWTEGFGTAALLAALRRAPTFASSKSIGVVARRGQLPRPTRLDPKDFFDLFKRPVQWIPLHLFVGLKLQFIEPASLLTNSSDCRVAAATAEV